MSRWWDIICSYCWFNLPAEAPREYHCCAFGQSLTELLSTGHPTAFHGSVHEGSIKIQSDVTGGQDILSNLSYVKRLVEKKVILLIGKLSYLYLERSLGYWESSLWFDLVQCSSKQKQKTRNFRKSFILK